ncbi:MAG: hypothetical protein GY754_15785 [bacterium]|nr:hypothetical protein [bacterium]
MPIINLHPMFTDIKKEMKGMVYSKWKGINYVRSKGTSRHDPHTEEQTKVRNNFKNLVRIWQQFKNDGGPMQKSWNLDVKGKQLTGYNQFIQQNFHNYDEGEPLELFKPIEEERTVQNFQVATGTTTGRIQCTFDQIPDGMHLTIFVEEADNGVLSEELTRHDLGIAASSPQTIQNLSPGVNYIAYAILTDEVYSSAQTVSEAVTGNALTSGTRLAT